MIAGDAITPTSTEPDSTRLASFRALWQTRLWPIGLLYSLLAFAAVMFNSWGFYVGDNRYEQYTNPARRLAKGFGVWDPTRGLGAPREDLWPGTTIPGAIVRGLGLDPWVGERFFHAVCLVTMALGVTALLRLFRPRIGLEHLIAGLYAGFGPYSATFLLPTNLYYMMALGPWLAVAMVRGLTEDRPWRWAAGFALLVAWAGNPDAPGLLYNAVVLVVVGLYLVHVERSTRWRDVIKWLLATCSLALLCSAWALTKTFLARDLLNARLLDTELPAVSALSSSWSESMRGLGNWLSYFSSPQGLLKPQGADFFLNGWVVFATFIVPFVALLALWRLKWRAKVLFSGMAVVSAAIIVGGFASPTKSPIGASILWVMENVTVLSSFRNTYKAGGGLVIGVGVLAGVGVVAAIDWLRPRGRWVRQLPAVAAAGVLITVAFPFWSGSLYHPGQQVDAVPAYWSEAFGYLDHLADPGLTAVVPAVTRANYRWGWVGDDIFDSLLARPHAISTGVPLSNPLGANALEAFTAAAQSVPYHPGALGGLAHRLGITEIVVRNDLRWESLRLPRPAVFDGLRNDPDFELVASFGEPGVGVVVPIERSVAAARERSLPPVEIYRVRQPGSMLRSVDGSPGVLVAGNAGAWPTLDAAGLVPSSTPIITSGAVSDDRIEAVVHDAAGVVITDTARRRLRTLVGYEPTYSATLGLRETAGRIVREEFPENPTAQTTVWIPDAESISPVGLTIGQLLAALRPANAFDGDDATAWGASTYLAKSIPGIEVKLRSPRAVSRFQMSSMVSALGVPSVRRVSVTLADGTQRQAFVDDQGSAVIEFPKSVTESFTIRLEGVDRRQGVAGLTEVTVDDLDLREFVQAPTDLFGGRAGGGDLTGGMAAIPTAYAFERSTRTSYLDDGGGASGRFDEEQRIRRRFDVARADAYELSGVLRRSAVMSVDEFDRWIDSDVSATASDSDPAGLEGMPADAVDGSLESAWISKRPVGDSLTVHVPRQVVDRIVVSMQINGAAVGPSVIEAKIDGITLSAPAVPDASCPPFLPIDIKVELAAGTKPSSVPCYRRATFVLPEPTSTDEVTLTLTKFDVRVNRFGTQWFVNEVDVSGPDVSAAQNKIDRDAEIGGECVDAGLSIGSGDDAQQPVTFRATVGDFLDGQAMPFTGCSAVNLPVGAAILDSGAHGLFESIILRTSDWSASPANERTLPIEYLSSDQASSAVDLPGASQLVFAQSYDPLWTLSVDGAGPVAATPVNGLNGWSVPAGRHQLDFRYRPSRLLSFSIILTLVGVALCLWLVMGTRRRAAVASDLVAWEFTRPSRRATLWAIAAATLASALLVGPLALVCGVAVWLVARWTDEPVDITGVAAPVLFFAAAGSSAVPLLFEKEALGLAYAKDRVWAHQLTLVAAVFAVQTIALLAVAARANQPAPVRPLGAPWGQIRVRVIASWKVVVASTAAIAATVVGAVLNEDAVGVEGLLRSIRLGTKYSSLAPAGPAAVNLPPLAPVLRSAVHLAPVVLSVGVVMAMCAAAVYWAARRSTQVPSWLVVAAVAVSPLTWGVGLSGQIAALLILASMATLDRAAGTVAGAVLTGLLLGGAVLARPDALVAVVVVAGWLLWRRQWVGSVAVAATACAVAASWASFCWSEGTWPWLARTPAAMVLDHAVSGLGHWLGWWAGLGVFFGIWAALRAVVARRQSPASR